jgi:hypothetical protein
MSDWTCGQCTQPAAIIDWETGRGWCLDCATALIKAGSPVLDYTELDEGPMYSDRLKRLSSAGLRLR